MLSLTRFVTLNLKSFIYPICHFPLDPWIAKLCFFMNRALFTARDFFLKKELFLHDSLFTSFQQFGPGLKWLKHIAGSCNLNFWDEKTLIRKFGMILKDFEIHYILLYPIILYYILSKIKKNLLFGGNLIFHTFVGL